MPNSIGLSDNSTINSLYNIEDSGSWRKGGAKIDIFLSTSSSGDVDIDGSQIHNSKHYISV